MGRHPFGVLSRRQFNALFSTAKSKQRHQPRVGTGREKNGRWSLEKTLASQPQLGRNPCTKAARGGSSTGLVQGKGSVSRDGEIAWCTALPCDSVALMEGCKVSWARRGSCPHVRIDSTTQPAWLEDEVSLVHTQPLPLSPTPTHIDMHQGDNELCSGLMNRSLVVENQTKGWAGPGSPSPSYLLTGSLETEKKWIGGAGLLLLSNQVPCAQNMCLIHASTNPPSC